MSCGADWQFCWACNKPLSIFPIFGGNVTNQYICGRWTCRKSILQGEWVHSFTYEAVVRSQKFNCANQPTGCTEKLIPEDMEKHEERCDYGSVICENVCKKLFPNKSQYWSVDLNYQSIMQHIVNNHTVENAEGLFREEKTMVVARNSTLFYILSTKQSEYFAVYVSFKVMTNFKPIFCVKVLSLQRDCSYSNHKSFVVYGDFNISVLNNSFTNIIPVKSRDCTDNLKFKVGIIKLDTNKLTKCIHQSSMPGVNNNLLSCLKCSVCLLYMTENIFLCTSGHSLCENCRKSITSCIICKSPLDNRRNHTLESVTKHVIFSCKYADAGCPYTAIIDDMKLHEMDCTFSAQTCVLGEYLNCQWTGTIDELLPHIMDKHEQVIVENNHISRDINEGFVFNIQKSCHVLVVQNQVFVLHFLFESLIFYWAIQTAIQPCKWMLELQINDGTNRNQTMAFKKFCSPYTGRNVKENACIRVLYKDIETLINNKNLSYNVKIIQK